MTHYPISHRVLPSAVISFWILAFAWQVYAQTSAGRVSGNVLDSSGALVPGAKVIARNVETGVEQTAESSGNGSYVLYPLPPGVYNITAGAAGFRTERFDNVQVDVATVLTRDFHLAVGAMQQEVTVVSEGSAPMLTQSISVESTIIRDQIESLPLNGRDFNQLVLLSAGAVENAYPGFDFGGVASNGNRPFGNDYQLDGTPNNSVYQNLSGAGVSVDVIREFKVTSGTAPAEYGQAGTQVTVVTRSGTNRFHGSLFEFHRGTTWQASDPFNPGAAQPFDRNQFGGSLGGPIRPNHTFFFFNYEGNRQSQSTTTLITSPLDAYWQGDFSSLLSRNIAVMDPLASKKTAFPGNLIPASRFSPIALALRPYWGSPNRPGLANNYVFSGSATIPADQFTIRLDHSLPRNQNLSVRYTQATIGGFTPTGSAGGPNTGTTTSTENYNASIGWVAPISARTVNELHAGQAQFRIHNQYFSGGLPTTASLGMQGFPSISPVESPIPRIQFVGNDPFTQVNYGPTANSGMGVLDQRSRTWSLSDAITHVRGNHTIKAGIEYRNLFLPMLLYNGAPGTVKFTSTNGKSSGFTFADLLMGLPTTTSQVAPMPMLRMKIQEFSSYVQDDWRVSRRLTLSFGLRYELYGNMYEENNRYALFDPANGAMVVASNNGVLPTSLYTPEVVAQLTDGKGQWRFPLMSDKQAGLCARTLVCPDYKHLGPRAGFVYQLSSRLILRSGYGIFYTRKPYQYYENTLMENPPFAGSFNFSQAYTNGVPLLTLGSPFAAGATASISPKGVEANSTLANNQQWNFTLERDLGWGTALSLGYVGNKGTHLDRTTDANGKYLNSAGQVVQPYSATYGTVAINVRRTDGNSIYNAMQTEIRRRNRRGLMLQANWTWAKGMDDMTGTSLNQSSLDVQNLGRDRSNSDFVRRHMFKVNATYDLPFGRNRAWLRSAPRWADAVAGGWRLAGLWTFNTGKFFTPTFAAQGGLSNNRPDVVYGVQGNLPRAERNASHWFNPGAFAPVPAVDPITGLPRFGNCGRNILVGPGTSIVDTSLSKSFPLFGEGRRLTFRLEFFNTLNHPNYGMPDANVSNATTVATINTTIKPMRQAQFAVRFDF